MSGYLLILTLVVQFGSGGVGGTGTKMLDTLADCDKAGEQWVGDVKSAEDWKIDSRSFYTCVKIGG